VTALARLVGAAEEERMVESARTLTKCPTENGELPEEEAPEGSQDDDTDVE
jgi:hypothetical protein